MGEAPFQGLYSLTVAVALAGMIWSYSEAPHVELWPAVRATGFVPLVIMPFALWLAVAGLSTRAPTQVGGSSTLYLAEPAAGILRVTRHPQLWAWTLWSGSHITANGDLASLVFFAAFALLALLGMLHIDHRRARSHGAEWVAFAAVTSLVPFQAILQGRNKLVLGELGAFRLALSAAVYVALLLGHAYLFGASPWP